MMRRSASVYAAALDQAWEGAKVKDRPAVMRRFLQLLIRQRATKLVPRILERLMMLERARRNVQPVTIAAPTRAVAQSVTTGLKKILANAEVTATEQPSLIGGVTIHIGDTLIDGSVATRLQRLHTKLTS